MTNKGFNPYKHNMRLYKVYSMFGQDYLFLYTIQFLFYIQVRNISASDAVFSMSVFCFFMLFMQIPAVMFIEKFGNKKAIIVGNILSILYVIILIFSNCLSNLIVAELVSSIAFSLKMIAEPNIISNSIPEAKNKSQIFSNITGKATSGYYYLNAISSLLSGFLYTINPYIPLILCIIIMIFVCVLSFRFEEIQVVTYSNNIKKYIQDLKKSFTFVIKSKRLRSLIIYIGVIWGTICIFGDYRVNLLQSLNLPVLYITIISTLYSIFCGIGSKSHKSFHTYFKNRSLSVIGILIMACFLFCGISAYLPIPWIVSILLIATLVLIFALCVGLFNVLSKRYLGNFSDPEVLVKIYSVKNFSENFFRMIITLIASILVDKTNAISATILLGLILLFSILLILVYMKGRIGLSPEKYDRKDIEYKNII